MQQTDERPNVQVNYISKNETSTPPTCLEVIAMIITLAVIIITIGIVH